jgi:capsular exopolysaccharide synthesis family protein
MGKIFEAMKKSQALTTQPSSTPIPKRVVEIKPEKIDSLKLDTTASRGLPETAQGLEWNMDPRLMSFIEPDSVAGECFKMLRAKILTRDAGSRPRTIMVTSPQPMDGKTTVSANLAISIARGINEYVLLLDCDLRRPSLAKALGLSVREGLREYLEGGTSLEPYLRKTPVEKLTLLPGGQPPVNPSELLSSQKMRDLVKELKSRYDNRYIIFDASPARFGAETTFLASMVDAVILVVRSGRTSKDDTLESIQNIGSDKILGVVLNATAEQPKAYYQYYRYYHKRPT